ncbi:MAG: PHP domain-containing protein [Clostridia bacterium]|nr:PHP domain-containing protein [Clostridia bacterium]
MAVDLHIHSIASSDGELSAKQILEMALNLNLEAIAIADHDSIKSVEEGIFWGKKYGVEVIPACEIEGKHQGKTIHILGYFIEIEDHGLHQLFTKVEETRRQIIDLQIAKLREAGFYLEKEDVMKECNYTVPVNGSFVNVIFADPRNQDNPLIKEYKQKDNYVVRFAFDYLNVGKPFYVSQYVPDAVEAISVIYGSGGIPILAHPGSNLTIEETEVIDDLLNYGLLGLEVYTSHHNEEQEQYYLDYCRRNKIVYTCGSDFHGRFKPKVKMGAIKNNTYEVVERLKSLKNNPRIKRGL